MLQNKYDFFENEFKKYEQILLEYKKDHSKVFVDPNFHPTSKITGKYDTFDSSITWRRIDEVFQAPLFKKEKIHPLYIKQGCLGDCYFITALSRMAKKSELVEAIFEKQLPDKILGPISESLNIECGAVVVYFRVFGRRTPVLIDTYIPFEGSTPHFARPTSYTKSAWFCLVEKAFAKLNGSYTNIDGGFFSESFYSLFGYYKKVFKFTQDIAKNTLKILTYQKCGCLMDASIGTTDESKIKAAENFNLLDLHSYLLMKVRKYKDLIFYQLRNPWGRKEWSGDYSKNSDLWTPELERVLQEDQRDGRFWISEKDFYTHFTRSDVAKPVDPHWTMRTFSFKLPPSKDYEMSKLNQHRNFAFKLIKDVPSGKKARVRILIEKRNTDYSKLRMKGSFLIVYIGRNGGQKLVKHDTYDYESRIITMSTKVSSKNDIVTFVIVHVTPEEIEADCYVNVFCEYDFDLYDIDHPDNLFPKSETRGPIIDNFSISAPNAALVLKRTIINGKYALWLKNPTVSDFQETNKDPNFEIIIKNLIKEAKESLYNIPGTQIDPRKYIFNNELIERGETSDVYAVTDRTTGEDFAAIVSIESIEKVLDNFRNKVSIMMQLNYPSIIRFIGFSEIDFSQKRNPMIITDLYSGVTLSAALKKDSKDFTNTKKMINLIGIAFGMNYIHQHNIIHRYLRCSNILLDRNMHPKIAYFDTARINAPNNEQFGQSLPFYFLAPELVKGTELYSFPVDVFAYGMLFYHVIGNKEPTIKHKNELDFFLKIRKGEKPELNEIPERFHSFIKSMWDEDPAKRPTFDQIISKLLHSRSECWLENVDEKELEQYIHQFGSTLQK